jgi:N-acetylmuramoyl-L-alanine amidase
MGKIDRVKRRLVSGAVEENVDTLRGFGPWTLKRRRNGLRVWLRRAYLAFLPFTLIGSSWLVFTVTGAVAPPQRPTEATMAAAKSLAAPVSAVDVATRPPYAEPDQMFEAPPTPMSIDAIPLQVRRVILDAGHGGSDPGTVSGRLLEKDITLDINRRLRSLLESAGFEVRLTRMADETMALRERAALANSSSGDIFISVHVNSIRGSRAIRGIETYYLGPTDDPLLTELAASENRGSGYTLNAYKRLLEQIYTDARQDESRKLAHSIQTGLHGELVRSNPTLANWGVRKAPFVVLVATDMPAILAEVSCLSNPEEARLLATGEYRQEIAEALFKGIVNYAEDREGSNRKGI